MVSWCRAVLVSVSVSRTSGLCFQVLLHLCFLLFFSRDLLAGWAPKQSNVPTVSVDCEVTESQSVYPAGTSLTLFLP